MLEIAIPNHEAELQQLEAIGLSGYFLGFGLRFGQPDFFMNKYPDAWTKEYETENYFFGDPVAVWTITREGMVRWSQVKLPDMRKIMVRDKAHGLKYGATFVVKIGSKRSFLSIARPDRELTDEEMTLLMSKVKMWAQLFTRSRVALTDQELETLRLMHSGLRQSEAAELMSISVSGLKARLDSAQKKLGARNTTSAVSTAVRMNLI